MSILILFGTDKDVNYPLSGNDSKAPLYPKPFLSWQKECPQELYPSENNWDVPLGNILNGRQLRSTHKLKVKFSRGIQFLGISDMSM